MLLYYFFLLLLWNEIRKEIQLFKATTKNLINQHRYKTRVKLEEKTHFAFFNSMPKNMKLN
jgi:hypothetical protein